MLSSSAGSSDSVHVIFVCRRELVVDDMSHVRDIKTSSSNVGRHENVYNIILEPLEGSLSLEMILVAVNRSYFVTVVGELFREPLHAVLRLAEHENFREFRTGEKLVKSLDLGLSGSRSHDVLIDVLRSVAGLHRNGDRIVQEFVNELFDFLGKRRREEQCLPRLRHPGNHESHVVDESHVEHSVGLVKDDRIELRKVDVPSVNQVLEPSGSADDEVIEISKLRNLPSNLGSAHAAHRVDLAAFREDVKLLLDLNGELASRRKNQDLFLRIEHHLVKQRNEERGSLARARIRDAHDVLAFEYRRNGRVLDRARSDESLVADLVLDLLRDGEIIERMLVLIYRNARVSDGIRINLVYEFSNIKSADHVAGASA